ncbi:alpha/beta hydrolase [Aquabacterium sp. A7-Y]|uniref:alpha/beta hydrolase n=1 Tax=Aquabacterium sp. A7-Y TaxID=1349605 RepID=UPI00223E5756|nr:alpha/beta hydrolase [Aquabacterium sp. A7-Y]MCW7541831.1 alpha/beta hydrolase [Aquabacterium sp. A7-Y]
MTLLAGLCVGLLGGCAERLFFYPDQQVYTTPAEAGVTARDVEIEAVDGSRLHAWWLPARGTPRATVLHVHGNAANISNHLPLVAWLPGAGYNVLSFDYRGYGRSGGQPSLDGVVDDTLAALRHLRSRPDVDATRLVVLGQSLGGATATRAVAQSPEGVRLLVVDSAFSSYRGIFRDKAAEAGPVGWLAPLLLPGLPPPERDPLAAVQGLRVPLLLMHGSADAIIPLRHGQALYAAAPCPKQWLPLTGGAHLDALMREEVRDRLLQALDQALSGAPPAACDPAPAAAPASTS